GIALNQSNPYVEMEDGTTEKLDVSSTRTLTVVGVMNRLSYKLEGYSSPGYTIITSRDFSKLVTDGNRAEKDLSVFFTTYNPGSIYETEVKIAETLGIGNGGMEYIDENRQLLRYMGVSDNDSFDRVLYSLGAILIGLIMVGSVSLIYNSFSISVSERTKQFGLLSSVGATSKQLRRSVFFEALILAAIGIPLGVLAGILGIGVTLYFVSGLLESLVTSAVYVPLTVSVSVPSIVAAVFTALITILISANIPAKRSSKTSAVDAIRQSTDIKLKTKQVKTSWLTRKLFGMEGDLALKNLKRNKKRYRSTILSLFISVVLFVSASAFSMYLRDSVMNVYKDANYDLFYNSYQGQSEDTLSEAYDNILALDSVKQGSSIAQEYSSLSLPKEKVNASYYNKYIQDVNEGLEDGDDISVSVYIYGVDHDTFTEYINSLGLEESQFQEHNQLTGIIIDHQHYYDYEAKKFRNTNILKDKTAESLSLQYYDGDNNEKDQIEADIAAFTDTAPFGLDDYSYMNTMMLIVDEDSGRNLFSEGQESWDAHNMYFAADDPFQAEADIKEILTDAGLSTNIANIARMMQESRNIVTIISIFSYGFIILISLITIANVFNTISTNVNLRRREFAMLKSVGMTDKGFNKMLNFECILYGIKGLMYGLPAAIFITYLIYKSISYGVETTFYLPVKGIVISIFSVFIVVFVSMMYSMSKIRDENIVDALRNENL
ncbi:MAG: FtsX-like permease family protein, partial [Clostridia bacterium]|nr:FtsX-like permease family protein [Clostridia bacterium]